MFTSIQLNADKMKLNSEKGILSTRKRKIATIVTKMNGTWGLSVNVNNINNNIDSCSESYLAGLIGKKKCIADYLEYEKEKTIDSDIKISSCNNYLDNEARRCQKRLDELEAEIDSLNSKISIAEYNEEQERIREAKEAIANMFKGD